MAIARKGTPGGHFQPVHCPVSVDVAYPTIDLLQLSQMACDKLFKSAVGFAGCGKHIR
jgi:hypothetical protein